MEKVAQSIDYSIAVKGLSTEANGTLGRFAGLLREAPQWLTPICNPGKDWKVFEAKGMEYLTVLNALVAASEAAASSSVKSAPIERPAAKTNLCSAFISRNALRTDW